MMVRVAVLLCVATTITACVQANRSSGALESDGGRLQTDGDSSWVDGSEGDGNLGDSYEPDTGLGATSAEDGSIPSEIKDGGAYYPPSNGDCGARSGMRSKTLRTLMVGSLQRSYVAYLPAAVEPEKPVPLVYVFHGANQTGSYLYDATEYAALADREGIAVVFPDGQDTSSEKSTTSLSPWHVTDGLPVCGAGTLVSNVNDVDFAFLDAIRADIAQDQCLDQNHIFATGFSMGGYMSHHIGCDRSDFRAVAPHSGGTMGDLSSCTTAHVPVIIFHGTADPLIQNGCDDPNDTQEPGFPASATLWANKNGCQSTYTTTMVNGPSGTGQCYLYDGCPADGQVELCTFNLMGHAWAGATTCQQCIGSGMGYASATQLQWEFFKKYAW